MKAISHIILFLFMIGSLPAFAQNGKQDNTVSFKVGGNCAMCKKRIEKAALIKGVKTAQWNNATGNIQIAYDASKVKIEQVKASITAVGHDVEGRKASDKVYNELHECCKYERLPAPPPAATNTEVQLHTKKDSTAIFEVAGNCAMCKKRIETAALTKGVKSSTWDSNTGMITVQYDSEVIGLNRIKQNIAAVGHDTDAVRAKDDVYNELHECCLYERLGDPAGDSEKNEHNHEGSGHKEEDHHDHDHEIKGVVVDENSKGDLTPIAGVNVRWLEHKGSQTSTNENGVFNIMHEKGYKYLIFSFAGMRSDTVEVKNLHEVLVVHAKENVLSEVVVSGRRKSSYISALTPSRVEVLTSKELFKAACCDLSESFETNASVDVVSNDAVTGSKQIQMLGLSGIYTQLTVESLPGPRGLATPLGLNSIAGPWIESIQISKGIGSVVNGYESMAGQINVELKKPQNSEKLFFNAYANDMGRTDINLNLAQKLGNNWSVGLLLHDNFMYNKNMNFSNNGFRDLPVGNIFSGVNRWAYENGKGFIAQFGVKYLKDDRIGGQVDFDEKTDKLTTNRYGVGFDINRFEGFAKFGYVFEGNSHRSIGLQLSGTYYDQKNYFGIRTYDAEQKNGYANLIYQDIIGSVAHKYRTGMTVTYDNIDETLAGTGYARKEVVSGVFGEYTYSPNEKFDAVLGMRADYNSLYGWFGTPRMQLRYQPIQGTTLRLSSGRGQRTANIFAENMAAMASSRALVIKSNNPQDKAYGLSPEVSWNTGISVDQTFQLLGREAGASVEVFSNHFQNQVVVDFENPREVAFYNLDGKSYSNSMQAELRFMPAPHLEARMAYRLLDVKTDYADKRLSKPLLAKHRGFLNLAYTLHSGWNFDYTLNIVGQKRLPSTTANPVEYQLPAYSKSYATMNAQVSKTFGAAKNFDIYVGAENFTNYYQKNPILAHDDPFGNYFDTNMLWGPLSGRLFYTGVRYHIK
ncbi:cation transporter [Sphingobacterium sp. SYP-B4668]|uniref:cation transporter n=1 Tax=Sphingobacterium sp. SYP-B4668 TaxID=2996035 RepID=UPI0022DE96DD|nr:cation transporter [Sphingobacterium sp. SYP-B4668]